jgi:hypothetical protein
MHDSRREPQEGDGLTRPTTGARKLKLAIRFDPRAITALSRNRNALPEKANVKAFCVWMRSLGLSGEQLLSDLYVEFSETMEMMGGDQIPLKRFGRALKNAGYPPYQADKIGKDGKRWRPMAVNLSGAKPEMAAIATTVSRIVTSATTTKRLPTSDIRVPNAMAA